MAILMTEVDRIKFACSEGRYAGAEAVTRIGQTVGRYCTVTLVRFDGYDAVGDTYGVVLQHGGPHAVPDTWQCFNSRSEAAALFAEAAESAGL